VARDWRDAPDAVEPTVLFLGGFITSPPLYLRMRRRLLRRGAAAVIIAPVWLPDWLLVPARGMGAILGRSGRAMLLAGEMANASPRSGGAPLLVVGHSAGGITARLLTSPEPFAGRRLGAAARMGAIVTLGTPHLVSSTGLAGRRLAETVLDFANRVVPGPFFAPATGYLTVASAARRGRLDGDPVERVVFRLYRSIHADGPPGADGDILGDGLVPLASAGLPGAETLIVDGVAHGPTRRGPWYGSDEGLDAWWPRALEIWHAALRARLEAPVL
jgi:hypothetical protein